MEQIKEKSFAYSRSLRRRALLEKLEAGAPATYRLAQRLLRG